MGTYRLGSWEHGGISYFIQAVSRFDGHFDVSVTAVGPEGPARAVLLTGAPARQALDLDWADASAALRAGAAEELLARHLAGAPPQ